MAASSQSTVDLQIPSESWDDDFDFQSHSDSPKRRRNRAALRMSVATEDWDIDNITSVMNCELPRQSNIRTDKINNTTADWTEKDLSTLQKASHPAESSPENWDGDFFEKKDSPARRPSRPNNSPSCYSIRSKLRAGVPLNHRKHPRLDDDDDEQETWDDAFDLDSPPTKPTKLSTPTKYRRMLPQPTDRMVSSILPSQSHYSSDDDEDAEFGGVGAEEDRTVTARSQRSPHTPPSLVPPIPFSTANFTATASTSTNTHLTVPSPRSPTASVFSVPGSSIADTTSLRSTAPLRPSLSSTLPMNGLRYIPPSPPLHRERRRLRKRSRPLPQGVMQLVDINHLYPFSDTDADRRLEEVDEPRTPSPQPASDPISTSVPPTPFQSTNTGGVLLSKFGSVTRWSSRRKKKNSMPLDMTKDERSKDIVLPVGQPTPRPRMSVASLFQSGQRSAPATASSSWFFRPTSPPNTQGRDSLGKITHSRSGSMTDLSLRGSPCTSSSNFEDDFSGKYFPNKLLKRKSLGFLQLKKGLVQNSSSDVTTESNGDSSSKPQQKSVSKRPMSMQSHRLPSGVQPVIAQRHASYGTKSTRVADVTCEDVNCEDVTRDRRPSASRGVRPKVKKDWKENSSQDENLDKEKEKAEETRGFMGNMRRLSIVSRHRRNKSGASLMETMAQLSSEALSVSPLPVSGFSPTSDDPPSLPPLPPMSEFLINQPQASHTPISFDLLPPIELRPPSPNSRDIISYPSTSNFDTRLTPDSSVTPATTSESVSATLSSSSFSSPSSPGLTPPQPKMTPPARSTALTRMPTTPETTSPHTVSLGRSTISPKCTTAEAIPRRNSLNDLKNDLKIPTRISQAQQGLKRDLGMVRDFAIYIEQLKKQRQIYHNLLLQMQRKLDLQAQLAHQPAQRTALSSFLNLNKSRVTRGRSNTNPGDSRSARYKELAAAFYTINSKYRISWECAELLVDLADGTSATMNGGSGAGSPNPSVSAPVGLTAVGGKGRERAITLTGDNSRPPTPAIAGAIITSSSMPHPYMTSASPGWRASTGRHDLSHRQLILLREMLNNTEAVSYADGNSFDQDGDSSVSALVPEEAIAASKDDLRVVVNRDWRWGGRLSSTITLPSLETDQSGVESLKKKVKRRLTGMAGIRDKLRALKRNVLDSSSTSVNGDRLSPLPPVTHNHAMLSTTSFSTDTSFERSSTGHGGDPRPLTVLEKQKWRSRSSHGFEEAIKPEKERGRDRKLKGTLSLPSPQGTEYVPKSSPRRPSLASLFRFGRKHAKLSASATDLSLHSGSGGQLLGSRISNRASHHQQMKAESPFEEDWDRMDSASDLDAAARALGISGGSKEAGSTLKLLKSPYLHYNVPSHLSGPSTPRRSASGSHLSLFAESPSKQKARLQLQQQVTPRAPRLSNVNGDGKSAKRKKPERRERRLSSGKYQKCGSVRSMPPQSIFSESRLAMTPENIKPLLENAKEVHARLRDCIMEIRRLLDVEGLGDRSISGSTCAS